MKTFGITFLGNHAIIKLNAKLSSHEREELTQAYPDLSIREIGKGLTRIEGCLHVILFSESFISQFKIAMQKSKIEAMQQKLKEMERRQEEITQQQDFSLSDF